MSTQLAPGTRIEYKLKGEWVGAGTIMKFKKNKGNDVYEFTKDDISLGPMPGSNAVQTILANQVRPISNSSSSSSSASSSSGNNESWNLPEVNETWNLPEVNEKNFAPASSSSSASAATHLNNSAEFENEENNFNGMNDLEDDEAFFALRSTKLATGASALSILFNKLNGIPIESMNSVLDNSRTMKDFVANLSSALFSTFSPPPNSSASNSRKSRKARKYNRRQSRR